jgi:lysophospholipase L1-like esterase
MSTLPAPNYELHNVAEVIERDGGWLLQRIPEAVRRTLSRGGQEKARFTPNVEIRFVWDWRLPATVTLSSLGHTAGMVCFGNYQGRALQYIGPEKQTVIVEPHDRLRHSDLSQLPQIGFSARVARLMLLGDPVVLHDVSGPQLRRPLPDELPQTRYLAYGSSITHGVYASTPHGTYPARVARAFGWDCINLGFRGSALAEPALADYIAARDDWDVLTLEGSVNMAARFSDDEFAARWEYFIGRIATAHPQKPIVVLNMFPHFRDLPVPIGPHNDGVNVEIKRAHLRRIVENLKSPHVALLETTHTASFATGLSDDLLHPGDDGFQSIAQALIELFNGICFCSKQ